jgi:hypothetical protein
MSEEPAQGGCMVLTISQDFEQQVPRTDFIFVSTLVGRRENNQASLDTGAGAWCAVAPPMPR